MAERGASKWPGILGVFLLLILSHQSGSSAGAAEPLELRGRTMGTTYLVRVEPPHDVPADIHTQIDGELRSVNDQMSTYLRESEISRFNRSKSTDWFPVSPEMVEVVSRAQEIAAATGGAFDVTVGPLVDAWSFGPSPRTHEIPTESQLEALEKQIGYQKLHVRSEPPAIRKDVPSLRIDLSAIAKGHGVDRIVDLLHDQGARNVFVEIGGEVRASGQKREGQWMVGIQDPAHGEGQAIAVARPLEDAAMATSGDYRNFFTIEGVRYSHTIDPRTGRPVRHQLASVSVIAGDCMTADAWATALNVVGRDQALKLAAKLDLNTLIFYRKDVGFRAAGVGTLKAAADDYAGEKSDEDLIQEGRQPMMQQILPLAILTACLMAIVVVGMAVGVLFGRRSISGSCGGLANQQNEDGSTSCSLCSNPSDACQELRQRAKREPSAG